VKVPEFFSFHQLAWSSWEAFTAATYHIKLARIATILTRTPPAGIGNMLTATNRDYFEQERDGTLPEVATAKGAKGWTMVLTAWSAKELAWKQQVLESILQTSNGRQVLLEQNHKELLFANAITSLYVARFCRMGSAAGVSMGVFDSFGLIPKVIEDSEALLDNQQIPGGPLMKADTEQNWMWSSEGRHFWTENNPSGNRFDPRSLASVVEFIVRSFIKGEKEPKGITFFLIGPAADMFGPRLGNANVWMRKVKMLFDPKDLSDSNAFVRAKMDPAARAWPVIKTLLFHPRMKPLLRRILAKQFK
jgi:glycolate oxidase